MYLYGCRFHLYTDHKPLLTILDPKTAVPTLAAARMQCWTVILQAYSYQVAYKELSKEHGNADALSMLLPNLEDHIQNQQGQQQHQHDKSNVKM